MLGLLARLGRLAKFTKPTDDYARNWTAPPLEVVAFAVDQSVTPTYREAETGLPLEFLQKKNARRAPSHGNRPLWDGCHSEVATIPVSPSFC